MNNKTVIGLSKGEKSLLIISPPILGAVLGWFSPTIAGWATLVPFIPFIGPLEWFSSLDSQWVPMIGMLVGLLAGIVFTLYAFSETLKITISDEEVILTYREKSKTVNKSDIAAIFVEGDQLVLLGTDGNELYREQTNMDKKIVAEAFHRHGYPFKNKDPFANQYRRWVADYPGFPMHVNTLLSTREKALKTDEKEETMILRKDLIRLGVVVRDQDKRQYVRVINDFNKREDQ